MRRLILLLVTGALAAAGYRAWLLHDERQALLDAVRRLTGQTRLAQAMVTRQWTDEEGRLHTAVRFVEVDEEGRPLGEPREFVVEGDTVYFDAWVLKFDRALVAEGDGTKGRSLVLFRRAFGERQRPVDGYPLDDAAEGGVPAPYRSGRIPNEAERRLWERFWEFARDPAAARRAGVRVAQGEAPSLRLEPGRIYDLSVDHAGGLNIQVRPVPAVLLGERD